MRRSAEASHVDGFEAFTRALQSTFPARDDAPLALALLRLLSEGRPVTATALARAANRGEGEVARRLGNFGARGECDGPRTEHRSLRHPRGRAGAAPRQQAPQDPHHRDPQRLPRRGLSPRRPREPSRPDRGSVEPRRPTYTP